MSELTPLVGARFGAFFLVEGTPTPTPAITLPRATATGPRTRCARCVSAKAWWARRPST